MRPAWAVWALVIAAAVQLVVTLAPDAYSIFGPYFLVDAPMALRALGSIVPFGLAAAVVVGANRWDEGRSQLWWGVAALAVAGVTQLASDAILADWQTSGFPPTDAMRIALPALFVARSAAFAAGIGFLAAGLWVAGRARGGPAEWGAAVRGPGLVLAVAGAVSAAATAWTAFASTGTPVDFLVVALVGVLCVAAGVAALALLGIVALWLRPASGALPELLIAVGSTAAMLGLTAQWVIPYAFVREWPPPIEAIFAVIGWGRVIGFAALATGFLTAAGTQPARTEPAA